MTAAHLSIEIPRDHRLTANRTVVNHGYRRRVIAERDLSATTGSAHTPTTHPRTDNRRDAA